MEKLHPLRLNPKQVAHFLGGKAAGWTSRKVRRQLRRGTIEGVWFGGRWTIERSEVERLRALQQEDFDSSRRKEKQPKNPASR